MNENAAAILHNTVVVLAFILLAITFKHWWIALFALIFFMYPSATIELEEIKTEENKNNDQTKGNDDE